jgi:hypothetical protein
MSPKMAADKQVLPLRVLEDPGSKLSSGTKYGDIFSSLPPSISADNNVIMPQMKQLLFLSTFLPIYYFLLIIFVAKRSDNLTGTLNKK